MDIDLLADELVLALKTVPGFSNRVHKGDVGSVDPPCAAIYLPEEIVFDETYGRGADRITWRFGAVFGRWDDDGGRLLKRVAPYISGAGTNSVKARLQAYAFTQASVVRIARATPEILQYGTIDYQGVIFEADIFGSGSA